MPPRLTLRDCKDYAIGKGGECLESRYYNIYTPMRWRCAEGHEWTVAFAGLRALNQWCPYCSGRRNNNLEKVQAYAISRGGICLETEYIDNKTKMRFQCFEGGDVEHIWEARWDWMSRDKTWCPYCSGKYNNSLELCQSIAEERGGKCLSTEYVNEKVRMHWQCALLHEWWAPLEPIKNDGTWCPTCGKGRSEKMVCEIISDITGLKYRQVRPDWLLYENGRNLELDGYNERERIAFEYHGIQHYKYDKFFHKGDENNLRLQQERDAWKEQRCIEEKVDLIIVPYTYNFNDPDGMRQFIEVEVAKIYTKRGKNADVDGFSTYVNKIQCFECNQTLECDVVMHLDKFPYCCANEACNNHVSLYEIDLVEVEVDEDVAEDVEEADS